MYSWEIGKGRKQNSRKKRCSFQHVLNVLLTSSLPLQRHPKTTNAKKGRDWRGTEEGCLAKGEEKWHAICGIDNYQYGWWQLYSDCNPLFAYTQTFISSVQSLSRVQLFAILWTPACQASLTITNSKSTQTHAHWISDAIQPSHPLSSPSPPAFNLSQHHSLFKWVSSLYPPVAKVLEFQLQHQSFQWTLRTDSFRMDWLDLLAVQGTLKSLLNTTVQNHQFFCSQLSL